VKGITEILCFSDRYWTNFSISKPWHHLQHQIVVKKNGGGEALHTTTASTNNNVLIKPSENNTTQIDLGVLTYNIVF